MEDRWSAVTSAAWKATELQLHQWILGSCLVSPTSTVLHVDVQSQKDCKLLNLGQQQPKVDQPAFRSLSVVGRNQCEWMWSFSCRRSSWRCILCRVSVYVLSIQQRHNQQRATISRPNLSTIKTHGTSTDAWFHHDKCSWSRARDFDLEHKNWLFLLFDRRDTLWCLRQQRGDHRHWRAVVRELDVVENSKKFNKVWINFDEDWKKNLMWLDEKFGKFSAHSG